MYVVQLSDVFEAWLLTLSLKLQARMKTRIESIASGHFGDFKRFEGLIELRWKNGFRVYAFTSENRLLIISNGGIKSGQKKDIAEAQKIRRRYLQNLHSR